MTGNWADGSRIPVIAQAYYILLYGYLLHGYSSVQKRRRVL